MAEKINPFEFNAPKFVDFTKDGFDEADDTFFEVSKASKPKHSQQTSQGVSKKAEEEEEVPTVTETNELQESQKEEKQEITEQGEETEQESERSDVRPKELKTKQDDETKEHTAEQKQTEQKAESQESLTEQEKETEQQTTEHPSTEDESERKQTVEEQENRQESSDHLQQESDAQNPSEEQTPSNTTEDQEESKQTTEQPEKARRSSTAGKSKVKVHSSKVKRDSLGCGSMGVRQSGRLSAISKALRRTSASRRSLGDGQTSSGGQESKVNKRLPQSRVTPRVSGAKGITLEDRQQLQAVATFRHKITTNKKKDVPAKKQPLRPTKPQEFHFATDQRIRKQPTEEPTPVPTPASRPHRSGPTKPQEFSFATDARLKFKGQHKSQQEEEAPVEFVKSLRSSTTSLNKDSESGSSRGVTVPQPFHLSQPRKLNTEEPHKFVSMAELNCKFYVQTPERFRTKRASSEESDFDSHKKPRGRTIPRTPNFATTSRRRRSLSLMTREEKEQHDFEEEQKHAFKARPVNKKALQPPSTGYKVEKKQSTVPEPFKITETKKSKPLLPECFMEGVGEEANLSVASLPHGGLPLRSKRHNTKLQPFSFDARDRHKRELKEEKIKKLLEEEKSLAEFHARPMPVLEDGPYGVPPKKPPTPTRPQPFTMHADQRGSLKQEKFIQQLEEDAKADAARREFRAQDDSVVHKKPFIPEKSNKPFTEISNFKLHTEVRAADRTKYEEDQKMLEEEMLAEKKLAEERREAEEQAEVARLRREAVHKAQPVPKFKPLVIQPASQLPTVPVSPNLATDSRLRSRSNSITSNSTFDIASNSTLDKI